MKTLFLSLALTLTCALIAHGQQLATIKDDDGFTNVRAGSSAGAKVIGKFYVGDVFSYGEEQNGWVKIYYWPADTPRKLGLEGYIHKDRLLPLANLRRLLRNDSMSVELSTALFKPNGHLLRRDQQGHILEIDGKRPLGTDGNMPLEKITGLRMTIGGQPVDIPAAAWANLYDPTPETLKVLGDRATGFIYVDLQAVRDAGSYEVVWVIKDLHFIKRYVDQSEN